MSINNDKVLNLNNIPETFENFSETINYLKKIRKRIFLLFANQSINTGIEQIWERQEAYEETHYLPMEFWANLRSSPFIHEHFHDYIDIFVKRHSFKVRISQGIYFIENHKEALSN